jgi:hypothetical protein
MREEDSQFIKFSTLIISMTVKNGGINSNWKKGFYIEDNKIVRFYRLWNPGEELNPTADTPPENPYRKR